MYKSFLEIIEKARQLPVKPGICVAGAADYKILQVVKNLMELELCCIILTGDGKRIREIGTGLGIDLSRVTIIEEFNDSKLGTTAAAQVSSGKADVLVKGKMNSSDFLRGVLDQEVGLRTGRKLSVLTCYMVPGQKKLFFLSDGGMIIAPALADKVDILRNSVTVLHSMGIKQPKIAILAANEVVNPRMPSTVDAEALCKMADSGLLPEGIYEGPIAFDVAMRPEAAAAKGIESRVSGDVDLLLVPDIEVGNSLGKAISYFGGGDTAGIVVGTAKPVVMSSRAASVVGKTASVAWALLASQG